MPNPLNQENIPRLPSRQNNSDVFCTYFFVYTHNSKTVFQWKNVPHLKRNFELYKKNNEAFAQFCSEPNQIKSLLSFWRNIAIDASPNIQQWERPNRKQLALEHLKCYLETSCYYATKKVSSISRVDWEECLSSAHIFIHNSDNFIKLLKSYDERQALLDTYVLGILIKEIKNQQNVCKYSNWRLIVEISEKKLREALETSGYREPYISQCVFARKYFQQVYRFNKVYNLALRRSGDKWLEPDNEDFQAAANSYNTEKYLSSAPHEVSAGSNISGEQMKAWMNICITALQSQPKIFFCNLEEIDKTSENNQEQNNEKWLDNSEHKEISVEAEEADSEENPLLSETQSAFHNELVRLKGEQHQILLLYYGANLKQKQLEIKLGMSQSAISRRLQTIKKQLLRTLTQKSQSHEWIANYVAQWLHKDFRAPRHSELIEEALVQATKELSSSEQQVLRMCYGEPSVNEQNIANHLGISLLDVNAIITKSQDKLEAHLMHKLTHWEKDCVEKWLKSFYQYVLVIGQTINLSLEMEDDCQEIDKIVKEYLQDLKINKKGE